MKLETKCILLIMILICCISKPVLAAQNDDMSIPENAEVFQDHQYLVVNPPSLQRTTPSYSWIEAKEWCESKGGHLVTINSTDEYRFIRSLINDIPEYKEEKDKWGQFPMNCFWIGVYSTPNAKTRSLVTDENFQSEYFYDIKPGMWQTNKLFMYTALNPSEGKCDVSGGIDGDYYGENLGFGFICEWDKNDLISITKASVSIKDDYYYTGQAIKPEITVKYKNETLKQDEDFTVSSEEIKNAGTYTITINGKGRFNDTTKKTLRIKPIDIATCTVELPDGNKYNYKEKLEPPVVVKHNDTLIDFLPDLNYKLSYVIDKENNKGTVTVIGVKNITGSKEIEFEVIAGFIWPTKSTRVSTLFYYSSGYKANPYGSHGIGNPIDIPGKIGDDVYAVQDGIVTDASYGAYGNHIYIKLEDGSQLIYGHLSKFDVSTNDKVKAGQKIGELGNTGKHTTGPHLHFAWTGGNAWSEYYKELHLTYDYSVYDANSHYYGVESKSTEVIDWFKAHYYKDGKFQSNWVQ